ncbi:ribonuclease H-like superfamily protein [Striga asiatica]|uniref:Ribonuclease H-like superfamily protein n=1 Tax=Striga asiatica TaxID=4170 RepID=A0A5A7R7K4_STRAF|nr:ribonuclease H-like superfamily protein [Striga asiatica]
MEKLWDRIWKLKIKPKLKIFLWRSVHESFPVAGNLHKKGQRSIFVSACVIPLADSGFRGIAVDETGSICRNWVVFLHHSCDHSESLLLGVKHALWRAFLLDRKSISVKVDEKMAQDLQERRSLEGSCRTLFEDICSSKFIFSYVSFLFVAQEDWIDECACLALNVVESSSSHHWLDVCPTWS